jgi:hypothetical protein
MKDFEWVKVGQKVEFEMNRDGDPRWDFAHDRGGTGEYATGIILGVQELSFSVDEGSRSSEESGWSWPLPMDDIGYPGSLYDKPGYLRPIKEDSQDG